METGRTPVSQRSDADRQLFTINTPMDGNIDAFKRLGLVAEMCEIATRGFAVRCGKQPGDVTRFHEDVNTFFSIATIPLERTA